MGNVNKESLYDYLQQSQILQEHKDVLWNNEFEIPDFEDESRELFIKALRDFDSTLNSPEEQIWLRQVAPHALEYLTTVRPFQNPDDGYVQPGTGGGNGGIPTWPPAGSTPISGGRPASKIERFVHKNESFYSISLFIGGIPANVPLNYGNGENDWRKTRAWGPLTTLPNNFIKMEIHVERGPVEFGLYNFDINSKTTYKPWEPYYNYNLKIISSNPRQVSTVSRAGHIFTIQGNARVELETPAYTDSQRWIFTTKVLGTKEDGKFFIDPNLFGLPA